MQPDPYRSSSESPKVNHVVDLSLSTQYGSPDSRHFIPTAPSADDGHGVDTGSATEWSMSSSPSAELSSPSYQPRLSLEKESHGNRISPGSHEDVFEALPESLLASLHSIHGQIDLEDSTTTLLASLQNLPEETLFHIISHLSGKDLLTLKLVSRRFHHLVNSPMAWMRAFAKAFPGAEALRSTSKQSSNVSEQMGSSRRSFTRLTTSGTWSAEYLLRIRLLRCLARGKPSLPFAAACPGKPGRGFASFSFQHGLRAGLSITHLHADFGSPLDKRKPQFIHGHSGTGAVTTSDRKGRYGSWHTAAEQGFGLRSFSSEYPGHAFWGLVDGSVLGVPNLMDTSTHFGMVCAEGIPNGRVLFQPSGYRHSRDLVHQAEAPPLRGPGFAGLQLANITPCTLWIAKSIAISRLFDSQIGIMCGFSDGVLCAFSLGTPGRYDKRIEPGLLTAKWLVCPGVPIIGIAVDEDITLDRVQHGRVWAVVLNALGEVYYLSSTIKKLDSGLLTNIEPEQRVFAHAYNVGLANPWTMIPSSLRVAKSLAATDTISWGPTSTQTPDSIASLLAKKPDDMQKNFEGWDMRRRMEVDFAAGHVKDGGESIVVIGCNSESSSATNILRYVRAVESVGDEYCQGSTAAREHTDHQVDEQPWSFKFLDNEPGKGKSSVNTEATPKNYAWLLSELSLGKQRGALITTSTIDLSVFARTTQDEEAEMARARSKKIGQSSSTDGLETDMRQEDFMPGGRARFVAVGTASGAVVVWNMRAAMPRYSSIVNVISPLRIINTESPSITTLAISALQLVHGGEDGLVQAWDPLASGLGPVRTLNSRNTYAYVRRQQLAEQRNTILPVFNCSATAIALDPDPTILRGVVAVGLLLRYWSYSSTLPVDDGRNQKRRGRKSNKGPASSPDSMFVGSKRMNLRNTIDDGLMERQADQQLKRAEKKEQRRLAGRFGLDLLGEDATEEEMMAYATMLSRESQRNDATRAISAQMKLDADQELMDNYASTLNEEERKQWDFASWQERYHLAVSESTSVLGEAGTTAEEDDMDLNEAIKRSLDSVAQPAHEKPVESPELDDLDLAIARSLADVLQSSDGSAQSSPVSKPT